MFKHLREDWLWIALPAVLVLIGSIVVVLLYGPDEMPMFTYNL